MQIHVCKNIEGLMRIVLLPTAGHYQMTAHVTNCERLTHRSYTKPRLGTICRVGGKCARSLALVHDVEHLTYQLEVQPGATTERSCYRVPGLVSQD